jgi:hypothetical protein
VHAGKMVDKIDVQHRLENAPATLRRLFEGRNQGTAPAHRGVIRVTKLGLASTTISAEALKPPCVSQSLRHEARREAPRCALPVASHQALKACRMSWRISGRFTFAPP